MQLFYHETGRSVGCKYCFDHGLDEKPSVESKCTSQSDQCLLTLDYAAITQYNYTAITLTLFYKSLFHWQSDVYRCGQTFPDSFLLQLMGTRSHLGYNLQLPLFFSFLSNLTADSFSNQSSPTHRFQRDLRLLCRQKILIMYTEIQGLGWVGVWLV